MRIPPILLDAVGLGLVGGGMFAAGRFTAPPPPPRDPIYYSIYLWRTNETVREVVREVPVALPPYAAPVTNDLGLVSLRVTGAYLCDGGGERALNILGGTQSGEIWMSPNGPLMFDRLMLAAYPVGFVEFQLQPVVVRRTRWVTNESGQLEATWPDATNWWGAMPMEKRLSTWDEWMLRTNHPNRPLLAPYATNFHSALLPTP